MLRTLHLRTAALPLLLVTFGGACGTGGPPKGMALVAEPPECTAYTEELTKCLQAAGPSAAPQARVAQAQDAVARELSRDPSARQQMADSCKAATEHLQQACGVSHN
jgi:hypothetical protein